MIQWYSDTVMQQYKSKFIQKSKAWYPPFLTIIKYHLSSSITYQLIQWYSDTMIQITVSPSDSITVSLYQLISDISSVIKYHLSVDAVIQWYSNTVIQWYSDAVIQWYKSKFMQKSKAWYYCFSIYNDTNRNPVPEIEIENRKSKISKIETEIDSAIAIEFALNWLNSMSVAGLSSKTRKRTQINQI